MTKLSELLMREILNRNKNFYCLNYYIYCKRQMNVILIKPFAKILDFLKLYCLLKKKDFEVHQREQSTKLMFVIYVIFKTILGKASSCKNNSEVSHMTEIYKHVACSFPFLWSLPMIYLKKNFLRTWTRRHS